ncbi:MAG: hypothetical protein QOK05_185 [Chloroflexota bacterium]|nr:hypothetical protein [Chloroflexota bacterium]
MSWIRTAHMGVAGRWFRGVGRAATPVRLVHDSVANAVYGSIAGAMRMGGRGAGLLAAMTPAATSKLLAGPEANAVLGAVNGLWGDHLARRHPELAITMGVRSGGEDVPLETVALHEKFPAGGRRLAVFLHGLCETEDSWGRPAEDDDTPGTYGDRLRRDLAMAPVFVRYNSGLPVPDNGELLAQLLQDLVAAWPDRVTELALVGHSMGGLVMRAATDVGVARGMRWPGLLRHNVYLGTPHDGAPLARGVAVLSRALRRLPETAALAEVLDVRSAGIRDLESGYASEGGSLTEVRHHVIGATLGGSRNDPLSRTFGDLLVTPDSAGGRGRNGAVLKIEDIDRRELAGLSHFQLLDHPAVADALRDWLAPAKRRRR